MRDVHCYEDLLEIAKEGRLVITVIHEDHIHAWSYPVDDSDNRFLRHPVGNIRASFTLPLMAAVHDDVEEECIYD